MKLFARCLAAVLAAVWSVVGVAAEPAPAAPMRTRNVVLVMLDGLRWQEVFRGAEEGLISKDGGKIEKPEPVRREFWRDTAQERREALMPFLWTEVVTKGVVLGNRDAGSAGRVENPHWFSYPGYSETLCGFVDPRIDSNRKIPNPNITVFERLHMREDFKGRVAAFGAWDVFPFIFNSVRSGIPVDDSIAPIAFGKVTPAIEHANTMRREIPYRWAAGSFDALVFRPALEWITVNRPRLVFVGLGETDEWGHEGKYDEYLRSARRDDAYLRELWTTLQGMPEYAGVTTMIITCDHGRGDVETSLNDWNNHGAKHPRSDAIWLAAIGPDTPATGEAKAGEFTQSQIASTIATLLGYDYSADEPRARPGIEAVLGRAAAPAGK